MHYELGIYINRGIKAELRQNVLAEAANIPNCQISERFPSPSEDFKFATRVLIVGGETFVRSGITEIYRRKQHRLIGIGPGGTNAVVHNTLEHDGQAVSLKEFMELDASSAFACSFYPGTAGGNMFNLHIGLGLFEQLTGKSNEMLRNKLPPGPRKYLSKLLGAGRALAEYRAGQQRILDIFSIAPFIGDKNVFPEQRLGGEGVSHIWIEAGSKLEAVKKLIETLKVWQRNDGNVPPEDVLRREWAATFEIKGYKNPYVWLDGETYPSGADVNLTNGNFSISRVDMPIPLVAVNIGEIV